MRENVFWDSARVIRGLRVEHVCGCLGARERPAASQRHRSPHLCTRTFVLFFSTLFKVLATHQPVVTLVNDFSHASDEIIANPGVEIIREILSRHSHSGREVRRLGPSAVPRSTLRLSCRKLRQVYGFPSKHGEHINVLELRAVIDGVFWRLRSAANIHSKGSKQQTQWFFWELWKNPFRIAAPWAFGLEVQFARVCSIFHPFTRVLPDRPQESPPMERRAENDFERLLDFCVTV